MSKKTGEQKLFIAVITRALEDLKLDNDKKNSFHFESALSWVKNGRVETFQYICELAGFNPKFIQDRILQQIKKI